MEHMPQWEHATLRRVEDLKLRRPMDKGKRALIAKLIREHMQQSRRNETHEITANPMPMYLTTVATEQLRPGLGADAGGESPASPGADVRRGEPQSRCRCGQGRAPVPMQTWAGAGPSPGADVANSADGH